MADDRRNDQGQFEPEHSNEKFLSAVREHEPAGTSEIADTVGCTTQNADYRLRRLKSKGKVASKKVGRTLVWTIPKNDEER